MCMKRLFTGVFALVLCMAVAMAVVAAERPLTVVELYTSQGCSSCPPADTFLGELTERPDILALAFHVDYWDYIGWKDPFATPLHTKRQRAFAAKFSQRYVYTPQMVVQGAYQVVGSDRADVEEAIGKARTIPRLILKLTRDGNQFQVEIPRSAAHRDVRVLAVFYDKKTSTEVKRGENSGLQMINHHVVRDFDEIAAWNGKARIIKFKNNRAIGDSTAVLLQTRESGEIIGAAYLQP